MSRGSQIAERMDAGDYHGAAKLAMKPIISAAKAKAQAAQPVSLDAKIAEAAGQFFARHPELQLTEASAFEFGKQIGVAIRKLNLDGSAVEHWESAWTIEQAKRVPTRPRQETVLPATPAPRAEPIDDLTKAAQELIESHGGTQGFKTFFNNLTAKQMESAMSDFRFQRAVEICFPPNRSESIDAWRFGPRFKRCANRGIRGR